MNELMNLNAVETMSSLEIAELTGKRHTHVLRDIDNMLAELSKTTDPDLDRGLESCTYEDAQGQARRMFKLNKEMTYTLVTGYNIPLRNKVIKRWQELEANTNRPASKLEWMRAAVAAEEERVALLARIEEDRPATEFGKAVMASNESVDVGAYAKMLSDFHEVQIGPNKLRAYLREAGYLMTGRGELKEEQNFPYQKWVEKGYFEQKPDHTPVGVKMVTFVTGTGQLRLADEIVSHFRAA